MKRSYRRLGWWFFRRFLTVTVIVFAAVAGVFAVIDLSQRIAPFSALMEEYGLAETIWLYVQYIAMEVTIEFLRFPDTVLTTAAGLAMYGIIRSGEAVSISGLGLSLRRVAAPVVALMFAVGLLTSAFGEWGSYAFTDRFEQVRGKVWGRQPSGRVVFPVPGKGLLCAAEKVLPDGRVEGLTVVDAGEGLQIYRAGAASYGEHGDLSAGEKVEVVYPEDAEVTEPFEARVAPLAALRLSRYGPFWVRVSDLLRLGGGEAAASAGKVLGACFVLAGLGMLACGLVMRTRETPSLASTIAVLVVVEGAVRIGVESAMTAWTPAAVPAAFCWGLFWPISVFAAGTAVFATAPS